MWRRFSLDSSDMFTNYVCFIYSGSLIWTMLTITSCNGSKQEPGGRVSDEPENCTIIWEKVIIKTEYSVQGGEKKFFSSWRSASVCMKQMCHVKPRILCTFGSEAQYYNITVAGSLIVDLIRFCYVWRKALLRFSQIDESLKTCWSCASLY